MSNEDIRRKIDEKKYSLKLNLRKSEIWKLFKQVFDKYDVLISDIIGCDQSFPLKQLKNRNAYFFKA